VLGLKWAIYKNKLTIKTKSNVISQDFDLKKIDYCSLIIEK
jgi:hypothetical protein